MRALLFALVFSFSSASAAFGDPSGFDLDAIAAQPGTEVIRKPDGLFEIRRGGVVIEAQRGRDGTIRYLGQDFSGHGAVMCAYNMYLWVKGVLDSCFPEAHEEWKAEVDTALGKIRAFIAKNNLQRTPQSEIDAAFQSKYSQLIQHLRAFDDERQRMCAVYKENMIRYMDGLKLDGFRAQITDLLSVPRPPVMNPCL